MRAGIEQIFEGTKPFLMIYPQVEGQGLFLIEHEEGNYTAESITLFGIARAHEARIMKGDVELLGTYVKEAPGENTGRYELVEGCHGSAHRRMPYSVHTKIETITAFTELMPATVGISQPDGPLPVRTLAPA